MKSAFLLLLAQAAATADASPVSDQALKELALRESLLPRHLTNVVLDDPAMRAEIRRVGFEKGCRAMAESRNEVGQQYRAALVPATVVAIRKFVPEPRLSQMRPRSFVIGPLQIYKVRIGDEVERTAGSVLSAARDAMRLAFRRRTSANPDTTSPSDNVVMPRADIATAVGFKAAYDLEKPSHLGMACAEMLIPSAIRPRITTEAGQPPFVVVPPK